MTSIDVNLTGRDQQVAEPWICRLCKDFDLRVTILKANVDTDFGYMLINITGELEEAQRAISWLMTTGLHVDAEQRAVGA